MDEPATGSSVRVCSVDDLAEEETLVRDVEGTSIAVVAVDEDIYAIENVCPHQGGPVGEGKVEDGCIFCPWHGWEFDLETGEHVQGEASASTYPVDVADGEVYVTV